MIRTMRWLKCNVGQVTAPLVFVVSLLKESRRAACQQLHNHSLKYSIPKLSSRRATHVALLKGSYLGFETI